MVHGATVVRQPNPESQRRLRLHDFTASQLAKISWAFAKMGPGACHTRRRQCPLQGWATGAVELVGKNYIDDVVNVVVLAEARALVLVCVYIYMYVFIN